MDILSMIKQYIYSQMNAERYARIIYEEAGSIGINTFAALIPSDGLYNVGDEDLYRDHIQEMLGRIESGADLDDATYAEILTAFYAICKDGTYDDNKEEESIMLLGLLWDGQDRLVNLLDSLDSDWGELFTIMDGSFDDTPPAVASFIKVCNRASKANGRKDASELHDAFQNYLDFVEEVENESK